MGPKKGTLEDSADSSVVVRKLIAIPHARVNHNEAAAKLEDLPTLCCCGRGSGGGGCARIAAATSIAMEDNHNTGGGASVLAIATCQCPESAARLFPPLIAGALDALMASAAGSPSTATPSLPDFAVSAAEPAERLWLWLQLLPITRSVWTATMAGHDVLVDASGVLADVLHDAVLPEVAYLMHQGQRHGINQGSIIKDVVEPQSPWLSTPFAQSAPVPTEPVPLADSVMAAHRRIAYDALGCGKLDAWLGVLWSTAIHVTKQPMLNHHRGPTALILCATQAQCDEVAWLLDGMLGPLALVVHNTFEPFPLMPDERRADVVVSTPMDVFQHFGVASPFVDALWPLHRVSALGGAQRAQERSVTPLGGPNVSVGSKRYQLDAVAQLAVVDVDGIRRCGAAPLVDAIFGSHLRRQPQQPQQSANGTSEMPYHTHYTRGVLPSCQVHFVCSTSAGVAEARRWLRVHAHSKGITNERRSSLAMVRPEPLHGLPHDATTSHNATTVMVGVGPTDDGAGEEAGGGARKRPRDDAEATPHDATTQAQDGGVAKHCLMLRNCLSLSQIVRDPEVVEFVAAEVHTCIPEDLRPWLCVAVALLSICGAAPSSPVPSVPLLQGEPTHNEVVLVVRRAVPSISGGGDSAAPQHRLEDALLTIAAAFRGRLLEGQPIAPVVVPEDTVDVRGVSTTDVASTVLQLAVKTATAQVEAPTVAQAVDCIALDDAALRADVTVQANRHQQHHRDGRAPPPPHASGHDCFLDRWMQPPPSVRGGGHPGVQTDLSGSKWGAMLPSLDDASCWGVSDCVLALRNIGPATVHDAVLRWPQVQLPGDAVRSTHVRPSVVEDLLTLCQRVAFVKAFLLHADTGNRGEVTLFVEFWTLAAAQAAFVMLHRLAAVPVPAGEVPVPFVVEWIRGVLFYEGAAADPSDFDDMPHPLDR